MFFFIKVKKRQNYLFIFSQKERSFFSNSAVPGKHTVFRGIRGESPFPV